MTIAPVSAEAVAQRTAITMLGYAPTFVAAVSPFPANLLVNPSALDQAPWGYNNVVITLNQALDDAGAKIATSVDDISGVFTGALAQVVALAAGTYTFEVDCRVSSSSYIVLTATGASAEAHFFLSGNGACVARSGQVPVAFGIIPRRNGNYRCWITFTVAVPGNVTIFISPAAVNSLAGGGYTGSLTGSVTVSGCFLHAGTFTLGSPNGWLGIIDSLGDSIDDETQLRNALGNLVALATLGAHAVVHLRSYTPQMIAFDTWGCRGVIDIVLLQKLVGGDTPSDSLNRLRNLAGGIRAELEGQRGQLGSFYNFTVAVADITIDDPVLEDAGYGQAKLELAFSSP